MTPAGTARPRVLLLHPWLDFHGGVPRVFLTYAREAREVVDVHVATGGAPAPEMADAFARLAVPVHSLGRSSAPGLAWRLALLSREVRFDAVVCTLVKTLAAARLAGAVGGWQTLFYASGISLVLEDRLRRWTFRSLARSVPLAGVSEAALAHHVRALTPSRRPAGGAGRRVIPLGVSDPKEDPEAVPYPRSYRSQIGISGDARVVAFTASFLGWKRHDLLIQAFSRLAGEYPDLHLLLIGEGPERHAIAQSVANESWASRVHLTGARFDARRLLGCVDLYAHPAEGEGFGLAVAEAMAAGLPLVAARSGSLPELVLDGRTGLLVEPGSVASLADAIERILDRPELAVRLGRAGRARWMECYSTAAFVDGFSQFVAEGSRRTPDERRSTEQEHASAL